MKKPKFDPELVKKYGEQVWRDYVKAQRGTRSVESCAYANALVAQAVEEFKDSDFDPFVRAIIKYFVKFEPPAGFF